MSGSFNDTFDAPFYQGVGSAPEVRHLGDIAINGHVYNLDTNHPAFGGQSAYLGRMGIDTIPLIRQQADSATEPGESTINPEDLWPRVQTTWHKGAGQKYFDASDSDRARFRSSLGVDPWTRGQLNPLNDTTKILNSLSTNLAVLSVDTYLYVVDGNNLKFSGTAPYTSLTDSDIQAGEAAQSVKSITSDGYTVWAALGSNGVHTTTKGATSSTHYSALSATLIAYVKGRLMAANGNSIYNITASGAAPSALFTHPNTNFRWVGFAAGLSNYYAAGYSGDKSLIYRTSVKADGTALDIPVVAGELPDGEVVQAITGYLGFIAIGTAQGVRLATQNNDGSLTLGALIPTGSCRCFEPQDRFIWFGYDNYLSSVTGLGRMDLTIETTAGAPAYATDLMAVAQGNVTSVATTPDGVRCFSVAGAGIYKEVANTPVATGTLDTGLISFGVPETKIALRANLKHKALTAGQEVNLSINPDESGWVSIGSSALVGTVTTPEAFKVPELSAQLFELELSLVNGAILESFDFRAYPASKTGQSILVPILLYENQVTPTGKEYKMDVLTELLYLESLEGADRLNSYQELGRTFPALVEECNFQRRSPTSDRSWWNGTLLMKLKVLGD